MSKEPLRSQKLRITVAIMDNHYRDYSAEVELPVDGGPSVTEEAGKGAIPLLLEVANNRFVEAKQKRDEEIAAEAAEASKQEAAS